ARTVWLARYLTLKYIPLTTIQLFVRFYIFNYAHGQHYKSVLLPLGLFDQNFVLLKINVLPTQIYSLTHPQTTAIGHQQDEFVLGVFYRGKYPLTFLLG